MRKPQEAISGTLAALRSIASSLIKFAEVFQAIGNTASTQGASRPGAWNAKRTNFLSFDVPAVIGRWPRKNASQSQTVSWTFATFARCAAWRRSAPLGKKRKAPGLAMPLDGEGPAKQINPATVGSQSHQVGKSTWAPFVRCPATLLASAN
jgi:hypothetical protein